MSTENPKRAGEPRRQDPEIRRQQILTAAKTLFREHGLKTPKIAEIAREAGISVGLIYNFFSTKDDIIKAIVLEDVGQQTAIMEEFAKSLREGENYSLENVLRGLLSFAGERDRVALMLEIGAELIRNPEMQAFAASSRKSAKATLVRQMEESGVSKAYVEKFLNNIDRMSALAQGVIMQTALHPDNDGGDDKESYTQAIMKALN